MCHCLLLLNPARKYDRKGKVKKKKERKENLFFQQYHSSKNLKKKKNSTWLFLFPNCKPLWRENMKKVREAIQWKVRPDSDVGDALELQRGKAKRRGNAKKTHVRKQPAFDGCFEHSQNNKKRRWNLDLGEDVIIFIMWLHLIRRKRKGTLAGWQKKRAYGNYFL